MPTAQKMVLPQRGGMEKEEKRTGEKSDVKLVIIEFDFSSVPSNMRMFDSTAYNQLSGK